MPCPLCRARLPEGLTPTLSVRLLCRMEPLEPAHSPRSLLPSGTPRACCGSSRRGTPAVLARPGQTRTPGTSSRSVSHAGACRSSSSANPRINAWGGDASVNKSQLRLYRRAVSHCNRSRATACAWPGWPQRRSCARIVLQSNHWRAGSASAGKQRGHCGRTGTLSRYHACVSVAASWRLATTATRSSTCGDLKHM